MRYAILLAVLAPVLAAQRTTLPLDGTWQIEDSVSSSEMPKQFRHTAPVPGLAHLAQPAFPDVDQFESREMLSRVRYKNSPPKDANLPVVGIPKQNRNYFWYRRTFAAPARKQVAILRVGKAQFSTAVWLNGTKIGEHDPCFSAGYFNLTPAMRWQGKNELVVRVGAHPAVVTPKLAVGTDFEKLKWTPGIYDSVSLLLSDNPAIESVQVGPRIADSSILVETVLHNYGPETSVEVRQQVRTWKEGAAVSEGRVERVRLAAGESRTVRQAIAVPQARLWSPEDPFLYRLETSSGGDSATTRFGMREFHFETATGRAYLNGEPYFLRGSNITLHRFFEDPQSHRHPWDEKWVRKLLVDIPKRMHWNSFRFCIGPVPDLWLEIADEAGLLIQNEFFIWTGGEGWNNWHQEWDADLNTAQFREWMRDNWNHPSVAIWDACNETLGPMLGEKVIPAVRGLDLSNRPWENGYNPPVGPDDPVEDHPYLFQRASFRMVELEKMTGRRPQETNHPLILNEYGWLWLLRDGTPTPLTEEVYKQLLGNSTAKERFELYAYYLAGLTEYWRAWRHYAGVLHFVLLTASFPGQYTSDHFRDVNTLELEPNFENWVGEAFKPLGVYINFWQPELRPGGKRSFSVMMINDEYRPAKGNLVLAFSSETGEEATRAEAAFDLPALGQQTHTIDLAIPAKPGRYLLKASAGGTVSRRHVVVAADERR
jgi:beta-galactosidase